MQFSPVSVFGVLALQCSVPVIAIVSFDINLDEPPEQRWVNVASYYKEELTDMLDKLIPIVNTKYPDHQDSWINNVSFDPEYEVELQGMVAAVDHPTVNVERLKWLNMLYEMDSPYLQLGCTGVLWAMPNGTVVHGRNLDDFSDDSRIIDWPALTFEANLYRGGQLLMRTTQWPGGIGVHTGLRVSGANMGWGIQQNTRRPNSWLENLAAASQGGQVFPLVLRRIMEQTPDYATALNQIYSAQFMAPQYFIISGSGPYEGAVVTVDRMGKHAPGTPPIQYLGSSTNDWHLVQTNDDINGYPADSRRPTANYLLESTSRDITTSDISMFEFLHTTPVFNDGTLFSTVMVPASGLYETVLPDEDPDVMDGDAASQSIMTGGMWPNGGISLNQHTAADQPVADAQPPHTPFRNSAVQHAERKRPFLSLRRQGASVIVKPPEDELSLLQFSRSLEN